MNTNKSIKIYLRTLDAIISCQTFAHLKFMDKWMDIICNKGLVEPELVHKMETKLWQMKKIIGAIKIYKSEGYKNIVKKIK